MHRPDRDRCYWASLQGLSHEIDYKNFEHKFTELGLSKGCGWYSNFLGDPQKVCLLRLMPVLVGLKMLVA
jgi:hypothetical protein